MRDPWLENLFLVIHRRLPVAALVMSGCLASCAASDSPARSDRPSARTADGGVPETALTVSGLAAPTVLWTDDDGNVHESEYETVNGQVFVEGDIALGPVGEVRAASEAIAAEVGAAGPKAFFNDRDRRRWPDGNVPYVVHSSFGRPGTPERDAVDHAIAYWNALEPWTGMKWKHDGALKPRNSGIRFMRDHGGDRCFTQRNPGAYPRRRDIVLGDGCLGMDVILHEMGHAMGLLHEHKRPDRNDWLVVRSANYNGRDHDIEREDRDADRFTTIGAFDTQSVMQYPTDGFARPARPLFLPVFSDRRVLALYSATAGSTPFLDGSNGRWNPLVQLDRRGARLDEYAVVDVDSDGFDDLVAKARDGLVWSVRGQTGWIPVAPGGSRVQAEVHEAVIGALDADPGIDVLRVRGREWTLYSSNGTTTTTTRPKTIRDAETADLDRDGLLDVFLVLDDRTWGIALGGNVLGPLVTRASVDMGVDDVEVVRLAGAAAGVDIVGFPGGVLSRVREGDSVWEPLFPAGGRGPLPADATRMSRLHFVHVNGDRSAAAEPVDLLTYSDGRDGSGAGAGHPVYIANVLGSRDTSMTMLPYRSSRVGVDARSNVAVGYFGTRERVSLLAPAYVDGGFVPAWSDIAALGTRYANWRNARLTDRHPLHGGGDIHANVALTVRPSERVELEAAFMSPPGLTRARVTVERVGASATASLEDLAVSMSGRADSAMYTFQQALPGTYRVTIAPAVPAAQASEDVAVWTFTVVGNACGDGFVDPAEQCDSGAGNSSTVADACRTSCRLPYCGDGVVDSAEQCDQGPANSNTIPGACRTSCLPPFCGDGIVDPGEACDSGRNNSNSVPNACRTSCSLPKCGDGVIDSGENCDVGDVSDLCGACYQCLGPGIC